MAVYHVELHRGAQRDLERLARALVDRVAQQIDRLERDPYPAGSEKLTGVEAYRIRVGDYRIIYRVDDAARSVTVMRVRHRREMYRKLR